MNFSVLHVLAIRTGAGICPSTVFVASPDPFGPFGPFMPLEERLTAFFASTKWQALEMMGLQDQVESAEMLIQAHMDYREVRKPEMRFDIGVTLV